MIHFRVISGFLTYQSGWYVMTGIELLSLVKWFVACSTDGITILTEYCYGQS